MGELTGLVDDATRLAPGPGPDGPGVHEVTAAYAARPAAEAAYVGRLVLTDTDLPLVRGVDAPLHVVLGGGAGQIAGPATLARRLGLRLEAVETTLRDPGDLAGNARRVLTAMEAAWWSEELSTDTEVYVAFPPGPLGRTTVDALDVVSEAGFRVVLPAGDHQDTEATYLLAWIDAVLDRELAFRCDGLTRACSRLPGERGFLNVLAATGLLSDGRAAAAKALDADRDELAAIWADVDPTRIRRSFTGVSSTDPGMSIADLREWESR